MWIVFFTSLTSLRIGYYPIQVDDHLSKATILNNKFKIKKGWKPQYKKELGNQIKSLFFSLCFEVFNGQS